jgi:predicted peptidase
MLKPLCCLLAFSLSLGLSAAEVEERDLDYPKVAAELLPLIQAMEQGVEPGEVPIPWRLHVPPEASADNRLPLIFFLHGAGRRGDDNLGPMDLAVEFWKQEAQARNPCFVLAPQCPRGRTWIPTPLVRREGTKGWGNVTVVPEAAPTLAAALRVLDRVISERQVDPARIYVVGMSMGGYGTWETLYRRPDFFAAAVPICGGGDPSQVAAYAKQPIWAWHGANDAVVPALNSRDMIAARQAAGGSPKYTELEKVAHGAWVPALEDPELQAWLFAQKKP